MRSERPRLSDTPGEFRSRRPTLSGPTNVVVQGFARYPSGPPPEGPQRGRGVVTLLILTRGGPDADQGGSDPGGERVELHYVRSANPISRLKLTR
jgi:hypothetical protein